MVTQANGGKSKAADRLFHVTLNDVRDSAWLGASVEIPADHLRRAFA
jgi:hypothetical protein